MLRGLPGLTGDPVLPRPPPPRDAFIGTHETTAKAELAGTHRTRTIEQTAAMAASAARAAGMTRLSEITGLDRVGIPAFNSVRPAADPGNLTVTGGKGATRLAARVSALMEAVERYAGERNDRVGIFATYEEVLRSRRRVLDPTALVLSSDHDWGPERVVEWWPARDIVSDAEVLIPAAAVLHPYPIAPKLFGSTSNGLASGNDLPEAFLHAVLEVIERDATAFGETLLNGPRLDLTTVTGPCAELIRRFKEASIDVHVRVFTDETRLPTFYVVTDDRVARDPLLVNGGFGCHLSPDVALSRALTEAALSRATVIAGAREDLSDDEFKRELGYNQLKDLFEQWFAEDAPSVSMEGFPDLSTGTVRGDIEVVVARLVGAAFPVIAADLSMPSCEFAVCRAVVPGMEIFHIDRSRLGRRLARCIGEAVRP